MATGVEMLVDMFGDDDVLVDKQNNCLQHHKQTPLPPAPTTPTTTRTMGDMFGEIDDDVFRNIQIQPPIPKMATGVEMLVDMFGDDDDVLVDKQNTIASSTINKTPLPPAPTTPTTTRTMGDMFGEIDDNVFRNIWFYIPVASSTQRKIPPSPPKPSPSPSPPSPPAPSPPAPSPPVPSSSPSPPSPAPPAKSPPAKGNIPCKSNKSKYCKGIIRLDLFKRLPKKLRRYEKDSGDGICFHCKSATKANTKSSSTKTTPKPVAPAPLQNHNQEKHTMIIIF